MTNFDNKGKRITSIIAAIDAVVSIIFLSALFENAAVLIDNIVYATLAILNIANLSRSDDKRTLSAATVITTLVLPFIMILPFTLFNTREIIFIIYVLTSTIIINVGFLIAYLVLDRKYPTASEPLNGIFDCYFSTVSHVLLYVLLGYVWQIIWIYRTSKFIKKITERDYSLSATVALSIFFFPYTIYWTYKTSYEIDRLANSIGLSSDVTDISTALGFCFPIISTTIMQRKLNELAKAKLQDISPNT